MAEDSFGFSVKAMRVRRVVGETMKVVPSGRDLNIQISSLERMAAKFTRQFTGTSPLASSHRQLTNKKRPHLQRLARQDKKLDKALAKFVIEFTLKVAPKLRKTPRGELARWGQRLVVRVNKDAHEITRQLRLQPAESLTGSAELKRLK